MEETQLNEMMKEMVEKTCADGFSRMANMPMCEKLYNDMIHNGYVEQAISFKNLVFYTTVLEPQLSDRQIIEKILKEADNYGKNN